MIEQVTVPTGERGKWRVSRFVITESEARFSAVRAAVKGRGYLPEGVYTQLFCAGRGIIMSDTPDERRDHFPAFENARGHVLINGLGLGMVLGAILKKPSVERVTVVEIDPDVVALVGPHYECGKLEIITESAFDYKPRARYGAVWHDIWDTLCADNLDEMTKLKRKYGRHTDWQGCWGESICRRARRESRSRRWAS